VSVTQRDIYARVTVDGHHATVESTLRDLPSCTRPAVLTALADHLGYTVVPLAKASPVLDVDPRYPWLRTLIERARADWERHGQRLVEEVGRLLRGGQLLPMTPANESTLRALLESHEVGIVAEFAGRHHNQAAVRRLIDGGVLAPDYADRAAIPVSYRMGRSLNAMAAHAVRPSPALAKVLRTAMQVPLTERDRHAIDYAQRRAAIYMRRPARAGMTEAERVLTEAERWNIGGTVARGIERGKTEREIGKALEVTLSGSNLANDADRVRRTELHFAHSHGAYIGLKEAAEAAGVSDPEVYKLVRAGACDECRRIWGNPSSPTRYRLSFIEQREANGGNFRLHQDDWGPTIGPVHPNCTEGVLLYWEDALYDAVRAAVGDLDRWGFGP